MSTQDLQQQLFKIALLGSERQTESPQASGPLQTMFQQFYPQGKVPTGEARESALLSAVAIVQQYQAVGNLSATFSGSLPMPDDKPARSYIPAATEIHLRRLLNDKSLRALLDSWLEIVADKQLQVPPVYIPALLETSKQNRAIRPLVSAVVGPRGQWLAQQNPDWQSLLTLAVTDDDELPDESIWEEGNTAQRVDYLRKIRVTDTVAALALLQAVWKQEAAAVRQELLQTLRTGLTLADEEWLESCLDDRSKGVRQVAATLLGSLPDSAFSQRHQARLNSWLQLQKKGGLLSKLSGKQELLVNPPEAWEKDWLRDGIEEKPPKGKGAKAWWLQQSLSLVPPTVWSQQWAMKASEAVDLMAKHEWAMPILSGWQAALVEYPDAEWITQWLIKVNHEAPELWDALAPEQAEKTVLQLLKAGGDKNGLMLLARLNHSWSESFSKEVVMILQVAIRRSMAQSASPHYGLAGFMQHIAIHLHLLSVSELEKRLQPLVDNDNSNDYWQRAFNETIFTLRFRADMIAALNTK